MKILKLGFIATLLCVLPAQAQECRDRSELIAGLKQTYKEDPSFVAIDRNGHYLEIFVSETGDRTWTVLFTTPEGCTRIGTHGISWYPVPVPHPKT